MAKGPVDMELKKAFAVLQQMMLETTQKLKLADLQIDGLRRTITHAQLTDKEVAALPQETRTFESVGRMFVLTEIPKIRETLENKTKVCEEKIKTLESSKSYFERGLKECENNLREMVQQRKDMHAPEETS